MLLLTVLFLPLIRVLAEASPTHLQPGALTAHLGKVVLVEDALHVVYAHGTLENIPPQIQLVSETLQSAVDTLQLSISRELKTPSVPNARVTLQLLADRLTFLQSKLNRTIPDYSSHHTQTRSKRGLLNVLGKASQYLFGTAMDEDVKDLQAHYNTIMSYAATNRKTINLNNKNIARLQTNVDKLREHANNLTVAFNAALQRLETLSDLFLMDQTLQVLEHSLETVLDANDKIIRNIVDARTSKVSSSLFPIEDLKHTLELGHTNFSLTPLYPLDMIQYYYPVLESHLTSEAIVIHVPFRSSAVFQAYEIQSFPFPVNKTVMQLDMRTSLVLVAQDFSLYSASPISDLESCRSTFLHTYHCSASLFAFLPISGGICEVELTSLNASHALTTCPYKHIPPKAIHHKNFHGFHYLYFSRPYYISVTCPDPEDTTYHEVVGHYAIKDACQIHSQNFTTYPSRTQVAFTANATTSIFPLTSLMNLNFTKIKYVTNTLTTLTFVNQSDFADTLEETLPSYLYPGVLYPSFIGPCIVIVLAVILMCLCIRKFSVIKTSFPFAFPGNAGLSA